MIEIARAQWGLGQREQAVATVQRGLASTPAPAPGEKPSFFRAQFESMLADYQAQLKKAQK